MKRDDQNERSVPNVAREGSLEAVPGADARSPGAFSLHIERLVLDGVPFTPVQGAQFQRALERELARLVDGHCHGRWWRGGGAVASLPAPAIQVLPSARPADLGRQVARSVFASLQPNI